MIKLRNVDSSLKSLIQGLLIGDVFYVDGDRGSDNARGDDLAHAMKTLGAAVRKASSGNHDYILGVGAETLAAAVSIAHADLHIIGIGDGGVKNEINRGWQLTCAATVDTLQPTTAADGMEIAGIQFVCNATDHILIDDAGAEGVFFHDCTVIGSTTASDAVRLDIEGPRWVINDNIFLLCKLPVDLANKECVVKRNIFQDVDTAAIGVKVSNAAGDRCIIGGGPGDGNVFNLSGGTGDTGVYIITGANQCIVTYNLFHATLADNINDSGTGTLKAPNFEATLVSSTATTTYQAQQVSD